MEQNIFSAMELDAIGEVMNISLGSSATAVSNLLDHRVDITTPSVSLVSIEEFSLGDLEPAIAVEIKYVSGLEGSNIMLLRRNDVKVIVDILMGSEMPEEEFEFNDLTISAVCEVMNQMMGASSTALSDFLGRPVNISTPQSYTLDDLPKFKEEHFSDVQGPLVVVRFMLHIEDVLQSEFVNVMSVDLARELLGGFGMDFSTIDASASAPAAKAEPEPAPAAASGASLSQEEIEKLMGGGAAAAAPSAPASSGASLSQEEIEKLMGGGTATAAPPAPASSGASLSQEEIERLMGGGAAAAPAPEPQPAPQQPVYQQPAPQQPVYQQPAPQQPVYQQPVPQQPVYQQPVYQQPMYQQPVYQPEPKLISARPMQMQPLDVSQQIGEEQAQNLELIMSVPLEVSVEIGRTRRKVEDILTFSKGSLVVLDKLAGDQVDLFVNGLCVARGDVVVVDDNFGVRITEVLRQPGLLNLSANNPQKN